MTTLLNISVEFLRSTIAINNLLCSINRFIDVFKKAITTPDDGATTRMSRAVQLVEKADDASSITETVYSIKQFVDKPVTASRRIYSLVGPEVRQLWIHTKLESQSGGATYKFLFVFNTST